MNPLSSVFDWIDRVFDPVNPLIGWYVRRTGHLLTVFLLVYLLLVFLSPFCIPLIPSSSVPMTVEQFSLLFLWCNAILSFVAVVTAAGSVEMRERRRVDEMFVLDGLTPAQRCYGQVIPPLVVAGLTAAVLLPCCVYLSLFGLSLKHLGISSLLPMVIVGNLGLMNPVLQELQPKRGKFPGQWGRWLVRFFLWQLSRAVFLFWGITATACLLLCSPDFNVPNSLDRFGLYFVFVFLVFGAAQFLLLRVQLARNLDDPRAAMILNWSFYPLALLLVFPVAWLPVYYFSP